MPGTNRTPVNVWGVETCGKQGETRVFLQLFSVGSERSTPASRMTVGCVPLVKYLVSDQRTLFHIGSEDGGRGGTGEENGEEVRMSICAGWLRPAGGFPRSPRRVEERSGAVSRASLNSPGEEWAWGEGRHRSEPAPLWKYLQSWLRSHVGETSVLTPRSHLTLGPFQCSCSYVFHRTWV